MLILAAVTSLKYKATSLPKTDSCIAHSRILKTSVSMHTFLYAHFLRHYFPVQAEMASRPFQTMQGFLWWSLSISEVTVLLLERITGNRGIPGTGFRPFPLFY